MLNLLRALSLVAVASLATLGDCLAAVTLEQAYQASLARSESVRQSSERIIQADERVSRLRGGLLFDVNFNATQLMQPAPDDPIARQFSPAQQTTAALTAVQPIFRGLREFAGLRQQKQLRASEEASRRQAIQRLYQDVATNYFNILNLEQDAINPVSYTHLTLPTKRIV